MLVPSDRYACLPQEIASHAHQCLRHDMSALLQLWRQEPRENGSRPSKDDVHILCSQVCEHARLHAQKIVPHSTRQSSIRCLAGYVAA